MLTMSHHKGPAGEYYGSKEGYQIVMWGFVGMFEVTGPGGEKLGGYPTIEEARKVCDDHKACVGGEWVI